jgi:cobalt-zinc-cadmium efflux system outer membrane protein
VADLAVLLAWPEEAHRFIATGDWPSFPEPVDLDDEAVLLARALGERPDVAARHKRLAQAEKGLTLARRSRIPDVTVSAGFAHDPSNNVLDTGLIGLSVPLPIFYQNQGEIGRAQVDVSNAELAANQRAQQVQGELAIALARWKGAKSVAQRYSSEILRRVTQVREVAEFAYHRGATSIIDLIQAERDYKNTVQEYHRAMANRTLAYLDLVAVLGGQAPDATGPTSTTEPDLLPARGPSLRDNAQSFLPARQTRTMRQDQREKTR